MLKSYHPHHAAQNSQITLADLYRSQPSYKHTKQQIPNSLLKKKDNINLFFLWITCIWNELLTEIKDASTVLAFAGGLNRFYAF